jgi:hypothetical protein
MRFGYWLPMFGGWLRNVDDERMAPTLGLREDAGAAERGGGRLSLNVVSSWWAEEARQFPAGLAEGLASW